MSTVTTPGTPPRSMSASKSIVMQIAEPSATMSETRRWNYVFKPGSEAEWLAMFGS